MKNLFKSLMLVAVAAMAFTACQNEPEANINSSKKSVLNIEASFDQTRSGFLAEEDADVLKSAWDGNEVIGLFVTDQPADESVSEEYKYIPAHTTLTAGGQSVNFTVEFDETLPASGTLRACSPYVQGKIEPSYNGFNLNVPTTQTPETNDVDPAAHILFAEYDGILGDNLNVSLAFEHYAAYGKMTVKGAVEAESVTISIDKYEYTLSAENVENGIYWFACEATDTEEVIVTVNGVDGKAYTKTLDLSKNAGFEFKQGHVAVFTVDMTGVSAGEVEQSVDFEFTSWGKGNEVTPSGSREKAYEYKATDANGNEFAIRVNNKYATSTSIQADTYAFDMYVEGKSFGFGRCKINGETKYSSAFTEGEMVVAMENDEYVINITFICNGKSYTARFVGIDGIGGGSTPADPVQLATPNPSVAAVTTDSVTVTWAAVANASSYNVSCGGATTNTTNTSATFTGLEADRDYAISVVAVGDGTSYLDSEMGTIIAHTEAAQGGGEVGGVITDIKGESLGLAGNALTGFKFTLKFTDNSNSNNSFECALNLVGFPTGAAYEAGSQYLSDFTVNGNSVDASGTIKVGFDGVNYYFTDVELNITVDGKTYQGKVADFALLM